MDKESLCFIEVKYRKSLNSGFAAEAVNIHKQKIIMQTARFYMQKNKINQEQPCRFDVVAIDNDNICLIKNAFGGM